MKLNILLPWILAIGMGAALGAVFVKSQAKDRELAELRQSATAAEELRAQVAEMESRAQAVGDQVLVPRRDKEELIKLRGEVGQLREESKRLTRELANAQAQAQRAQGEAAQASQSAQTNATMLAAVRAEHAKNEIRNVCINNLRQIDGAKQQWALEHQKQPTAIPQPRDIAPYLPGGAIPACPAGGGSIYTLNAVGMPPACSNPDHKLQ